MNEAVIQTLVNGGLWLVIVVSGIMLVAIGLEADKPLSGGLPGHVDSQEEQAAALKGAWARLGEMSAWVVFALAIASLPVLLWWIIAVHVR
jgi:hypothetical protein